MEAEDKIIQGLEGFADALKALTPSNDELLRLAEKHPAPQEWYDEEPDLDAIVLVPICPHTMSFRPIVIDGESKIEIIVKDSTAKAQITCDGQINLGLVSCDKVIIQRKDLVVRLIHPCKHDHNEILRAKLRWGENF